MAEGGAFWHDLVEHVVIWEDDDPTPGAVSIPAEADSFDAGHDSASAHAEPHVEHHVEAVHDEPAHADVYDVVDHGHADA